MEEHLGYPKHGKRSETSRNARNGSSHTTLKGSQGEITIAVPRDRAASFEPALIPKHQTRLDGFEDKILALYARGMTTRDIQAQVHELYGVEVSPTFISNVTQAVLDEGRKLAKSPLGSRLSHCLCGLLCGQGARESTHHQPSPLPGPGRGYGRAKRAAGDGVGPP